MILSRFNIDNSELFTAELKKYPDNIIVIICKNHTYLPDIELDNRQILCLKEESYSQETKDKLQRYEVFFREEFIFTKKPVNTTSSFSDKIMQNLLRHTEVAISDAAKYSCFVYNELDIDNETQFIVITASSNFPDAMFLIDPSVPEIQEKTQVKKILCYPKVI